MKTPTFSPTYHQISPETQRLVKAYLPSEDKMKEILQLDYDKIEEKYAALHQQR